MLCVISCWFMDMGFRSVEGCESNVNFRNVWTFFGQGVCVRITFNIAVTRIHWNVPLLLPSFISEFRIRHSKISIDIYHYFALIFVFKNGSSYQPKYICYAYYSVRKVPDTFYCENLVDFNEVHLHEATFSLHTHTWIFSLLSIASVDGKQLLSEVVFNAFVGFSL